MILFKQGDIVTTEEALNHHIELLVTEDYTEEDSNYKGLSGVVLDAKGIISPRGHYSTSWNHSQFHKAPVKLILELDK